MATNLMFAAVVAVVAKTCNIREESIIGGRRHDPVYDARSILAYNLKKIGFSSKEIALALHRRRENNPLSCPAASVLKTGSRRVAYLMKHFQDNYEHSPLFRDKADKCEKEIWEMFKAK